MATYNQFAYTVNKVEEGARISDIPSYINDIKQQQQLNNEGQKQIERKNSSSDEDRENNLKKQNSLQRPRPILMQKKPWQFSKSIENEQALEDGKFAASRQIAQQISKPLPIATIIIVLLWLLIAGFKGPSFMLINLEPPQESENCVEGTSESNCEINSQIQQIKNGYGLRVCWREMISTLLLIPLVLQEYRKELREEIEDQRLYSKDHLLSQRQILSILVCGISYTVWIGTLCYGIFNTSVANAYIFNNIYPIFTLAGKFIFSRKKQHTNKTEISGGIISLIVLIFLAWSDPRGLSGCLVSLLGALAGAVHSNRIDKSAGGVPLKLLSLSSSVITIFLTGIFSLLFEGAKFNANEYNGLFGVFQLKWIFAHILICVITAFAKTSILPYLKKAISSLTLDVSTMSEVFPAIIVSIILGYNTYPSLLEIGIYVVYVIALVLLAIGKNESQFEEIALHDYNNLNANASKFIISPKANTINSRLNQVNKQGIELTSTQQTTSYQQYQPPLFTGVQQQYNDKGALKKTTMGEYHNELALTEGYKMNLLAQKEEGREEKASSVVKEEKEEHNFLNDSIANFNNDFIKNLKKKQQQN